MKKSKKTDYIPNNIRNITGKNKLYENNIQKNLMNNIINGISKLEEKEQEERKQDKKSAEETKFIAEAVKEEKEFEMYLALKEKYERYESKKTVRKDIEAAAVESSEFSSASEIASSSEAASSSSVATSEDKNIVA